MKPLGATRCEATPVVLADAGVENVNAQVDELVTTGVLRRVLAFTELKFSNSMSRTEHPLRHFDEHRVDLCFRKSAEVSHISVRATGPARQNIATIPTVPWIANCLSSNGIMCVFCSYFHFLLRRLLFHEGYFPLSLWKRVATIAMVSDNTCDCGLFCAEPAPQVSD